METAAGVSITAQIVAGLEPGVNYKIAVQLDAAVTSQTYGAGVLKTSMPFKLRVQIRKSVYLPIEMTGDFAKLGKAADSTRLDLTLGEDSKGNGLPDAWDPAFIAASEGAITTVNPNDDADHDGLTKTQEYQAGTFAYDPTDGFALKVIEITSGASVMEFMAIRGRTYSVYASSNTKDWAPATFQLSSHSAATPVRRSYLADESQVVQIVVTSTPGEDGVRFFKLRAE